MTIDPSEFASFSHAAFDSAARSNLRARLIIDSAKVRTARLLRQHGDELARSSSGLADVLSTWCQCEATIEQAMRLPLALITLRDCGRDPVWIAALSAAHLHSEGREGEWQASFASPEPLAFGLRLTPPAREIRVSARAGRVEVSLDGGPALPFDTPEFVLPGITIGGTRVALLGARSQATSPVDGSESFSEVSIETVTNTLGGTASILRTCAPSYLGWVEDALSAVVPLRPYDETHTQSYSVQGLNGTVFASFPTPALKMAELLVHETSHQYYHYGQLQTLFSNGMDETLYWSPYVQKGRPIDRILLSFHAFANIVLFYRNCLSAGMTEDRDLAEYEIAFNLNHLGPMSQHLQSSRGLTPAGRSLFEPLRDELFR